MLRRDALHDIVNDPAHHVFLRELLAGVLRRDLVFQFPLHFIVDAHQATTVLGLTLKMHILTFRLEQHALVLERVLVRLLQLDIFLERADGALLPVIPKFFFGLSIMEKGMR